MNSDCSPVSLTKSIDPVAGNESLNKPLDESSAASRTTLETAPKSMPGGEVSSKLLRGVTGFEKLDEADLGKLAMIMNWRNVQKDETLIYHQSDDDNVYFLCQGRLRATVYTDEGKEIAYQILEAGTIVGEIAAIDKSLRTTHVVAESDAVVASLSGSEFFEVMQQYPSINYAVMQKLTRTVRFLCERVYELSALSVGRRINMELLRLSRKARTGEDGVSLIVEPAPTHAEIASRTNTQREAVTKHLSELKKSGLIEMTRRRLTIADIAALD